MLVWVGVNSMRLEIMDTAFTNIIFKGEGDYEEGDVEGVEGVYPKVEANS